MTLPSPILTSERDRSSAMACGTLCVLAVVQMVMALKLMTGSGSGPRAEGRTAAVAVVPVLPVGMPAPTGSGVPEIGQVLLPGASADAPPLPGSLMPMPGAARAAAPVSDGPPPIGSFTLPGAGMSVPGTAPYVPQAAPPPLPGSGAMMPSSAPAPTAPMTPWRPLPGTGPGAPVMPSMPPLPGSGAPAMPGSGASALPSMPAMPGATFAPKQDGALAVLKDVNYVVTAAKELRGMSDMQGTLELLRRANEVNPDHPAIFAEMAQTYEQMGLAAKATDAWRSIQLLGETKAGSFFELASRRLGPGSAAVAAPGLGGAGAEAEKFVRLGACQVARDFSVNNGERYVLRVPIARAGNRPINNDELNLQVFFFDRVNNREVAQTIAPEPVVSWQTAPVDWNGPGDEVLDVVYHLPTLSAAEIQQHGRRTYYGYMLKLYYNNKLQDVAAEPRDLLEFGSAPGTGAAGANPLLPPIGK